MGQLEKLGLLLESETNDLDCH